MTLPPFQRFLDEHSQPVLRFLVATVGPQQAEDCFQETFLSALRAYPRLRADSNLKAWVFTIAHRKAIDRQRNSHRSIPVADPPVTATESESLPSELWALVCDLPEKQRVAVAHRYVNDLPYADIAKIMDCSTDAARRNVHEGVKKLRSVLAA